MGALTIKPLAYKTRSWELNNIEIINFLDTYCGKIAIQKRGSEIMRILPSRKDFFYWISDRVRFFFESLKKQRITYPYILLENKYIKVNWKNIIIFFKYIKYISNWLDELNIIGQQIQLKNFKVYKNIFFNNLSADLLANYRLQLILQTKNLIKYENKNYQGNIHQRYYFEDLLTRIKNNKYNLINNLYMINDYPRLWSYIKNSKIIFLGIKQNINFRGFTLNNNTQEIIKLKKSKSVLKLFGQDLLIFTENYIEDIEIKQILLSNVTEQLNNYWINNNINNYLLEEDSIIWSFTNSEKHNKGIQLRFATHGEENANKSIAKIILPITTFLEEYSLRLDPFGISQKSIPTNVRAINMRTSSQILQIIKNIFNPSKEIFMENKFLKNLLLLKYGIINESFKDLSEFLKIPKYRKNFYTYATNYIEKDLYKHSEVLKIKHSISKKKNNYV